MIQIHPGLVCISEVFLHEVFQRVQISQVRQAKEFSLYIRHAGVESHENALRAPAHLESSHFSAVFSHRTRVGKVQCGFNVFCIKSARCQLWHSHQSNTLDYADEGVGDVWCGQ